MKKTITYILSSAIILVTVLCVLTPDFMFFKSMSEYTVHIMFFLLVLGLLFLVFNNPKLLFISFLCTGILAMFLKEASNTALRYPEENILHNLNIAHFNLSNLQHDLADVIKVINTQNPDIITFQEYTPEWTNILRKVIKNKFKFSRTEVRIDPFGMAVYSKLPMHDVKILPYNKIPNLSFSVNVNEEPVNLILSYILPPVMDQIDQNTNDHLTMIGDFISSIKTPAIVLGDFNMVYWSTEITRFRNKYKLNNSRKQSNSFGLTIPYDHMFYTHDLECTSLLDISNEKGEHIGINGVFQAVSIIKEETSIGYINR